MAQGPDQSKRSARRTPLSSMADQLYPDGAATEDGQNQPSYAQDSQEISPPQASAADRMYPNDAQSKDESASMRPYRGARAVDDTLTSSVDGRKSIFDGTDDSNCYKPEDQADRIAKMARAPDNQEPKGPLEYIGKFDLALVKGAGSIFTDIFKGSKDTTSFLLDLSGSNGDAAKAKARTELGNFVDGTVEGGAAAYRGLHAYFTDPEIRDAVNGAIQKHAPEMWDKIREGGWAYIGDPEKAGRFIGRSIVSRGMKGATGAESAAAFFLKKLRTIGSLDASGKDAKSKVEGLLFGSDYVNRSGEQGAN